MSFKSMNSKLSLAFLLLSFALGAAHAQSDATEEAVQRLVHSHDPSIFVATGALYLKQEAIRTARGNALSPTARAEVERIIDANVRGTTWFYAGLSAAVAPYLTAEEADEVATHFATDTGRLQRRAIELAVGEVLMNVYTFTDRIDYRVKDSSRELEALQEAVGPLRGTCACPTPRELNELTPVSEGGPLPGVEDLSDRPEAVKFASRGAGVKYMKVLMIQGIESMTNHFESVARQIRSVAAADNASRQ
jgi:hypothetical protein